MPDDIHHELTKRAAGPGQSLQACLLAQLQYLAQRSTLEEVLDEIERRRFEDPGTVGLLRLSQPARWQVMLLTGLLDRMHNACMASVTIRNLPDEVHRRLLEQASASGKSLQVFLTAELTRTASAPSKGEILERIERRARSAGLRLPPAQAAEILRDERDRP